MSPAFPSLGREGREAAEGTWKLPAARGLSRMRGASLDLPLCGPRSNTGASSTGFTGSQGHASGNGWSTRDGWNPLEPPRLPRTEDKEPIKREGEEGGGGCARRGIGSSVQAAEQGGVARAQEPGRWRPQAGHPRGGRVQEQSQRSRAGAEGNTRVHRALGFQSNGGEEGQARSRWPHHPPTPRGAGHSPGQTQVLLLRLGSSPAGLCHADAGR